MKNTFIIFVFISIGMHFLKAQTSSYDLGIEGGPNLSTFIVRNNPNFHARTAVFTSAGFTFQYNTKKILSFRTGFSFQQKGFLIPRVYFFNPDWISYKQGNLVTRFDCISLPFLVKASFGKKVQFFVNAGPYINYMFRKTERQVVSGDDPVQSTTKFTGIQRWDPGVTAGIGITVPIKENWLISLEARDYLGLVNLSTSNYMNDYYYYYTDAKFYTHTLDFRIGLAYRMGSDE